MASSKHRDLFAALDGVAAALGKGSAPSSAPSLAELEHMQLMVVLHV